MLVTCQHHIVSTLTLPKTEVEAKAEINMATAEEHTHTREVEPTALHMTKSAESARKRTFCPNVQSWHTTKLKETDHQEAPSK